MAMTNNKRPPIPKPSMSTPTGTNTYTVMRTASTSSCLSTRSSNPNTRQQLKHDLVENERLLLESNNDAEKDELAKRTSELHGGCREMDQSARPLRRQLSATDGRLHEAANFSRNGMPSKMRRGTGTDPQPSLSTSNLLGSHDLGFLSVPARAPTKGRSKTHGGDHSSPEMDFAAEISQGLMVEVRKMQVSLQEKEAEIRALEAQKADLERQAEARDKLLRQQRETQDQLKEDSWSLELARQELALSNTELQSNLNKTNAEHSRMARHLDALRAETEQLRDREEKLNAIIETMKQRHETDMSVARRHVASLQREKVEQTKKIQALTSELAIAKSQSRLGKTSHVDLSASKGHYANGFEFSMPSVEKEDTSPKPLPSSSSKQTPVENHALEIDTLQTSLAHAHRLVSTLRSNLQKEKTEKRELKKMLTETQDTIEQLQSHPQMWQDIRQSRANDSLASGTRRHYRKNRRRGKRRASGSGSHSGPHACKSEESSEENSDKNDQDGTDDQISDDMGGLPYSPDWHQDGEQQRKPPHTGVKTNPSNQPSQSNDGFLSLSAELAHSIGQPLGSLDTWTRSLGDELALAVRNPEINAPEKKPVKDVATQTDNEPYSEFSTNLTQWMTPVMNTSEQFSDGTTKWQDKRATCDPPKVLGASEEKVNLDNLQSQQFAEAHEAEKACTPDDILLRTSTVTSVQSNAILSVSGHTPNEPSAPIPSHWVVVNKETPLEQQPVVSDIATAVKISQTKSSHTTLDSTVNMNNVIETKASSIEDNVTVIKRDIITNTHDDNTTLDNTFSERNDIYTARDGISVVMNQAATVVLQPGATHSDKKYPDDQSNGTVSAKMDKTGSTDIQDDMYDTTSSSDSKSTCDDATDQQVHSVKESMPSDLYCTMVSSTRALDNLEHKYQQPTKVVPSAVMPQQQSVRVNAHQEQATSAAFGKRPLISANQMHPSPACEGEKKQAKYTQEEADAMVAAAIAAARAEYLSRENSDPSHEFLVADTSNDTPDVSLYGDQEAPTPRPTGLPPSLFLTKGIQHVQILPMITVENQKSRNHTNATTRYVAQDRVSEHFGVAHISSQTTLYTGSAWHKQQDSDSVSSRSTSNTIERRSSISSLQKESTLYSMRNVGDPVAISLIAQTMIGDWMWKNTRKAIGSGISQRRHKRFFWTHPYTRTLYWSIHVPGVDGESNAKSALIEGITVVPNHSQGIENLPAVSLLIQTPGRQIKLTAINMDRHQVWYESLSYLVARAAVESKTKGSDDHDFSASRSATRASLYKKPSFQRLHAGLAQSTHSFASSLSIQEDPQMSHNNDKTEQMCNV